jgi:4-amino-4-deoxy-L-arabinose transferase-like glycosyltransferase
VSRLPLIVLLAAYFVLATALSLLNPLFESPDEVYHVAYVKYLKEQHSLPVLETGALSEFHQAPLYYTLGALAAAPIALDDYDALAARPNPFRSYRYWEPGVDNKNVFLHGPWDAPPYHDTTLAVHVVRLLSVLMGLGTVYGAYRLAQRAFDWDALTAAGAAAVVAFNPVFLLITSSVHNDALTMCLGALLLWRCAALVRDGPSPRRALWAGVLLGLDWLTKISTIFISPAVAVAIVLAGLRARQPWRLLVRDGLIAFGAAALLGGWTFVRNTLIYGEPTGVRQDLAVWAHWSAADALRAIGPELPFMWTTFWGRLGHGEVALPDWIFTALAVACAPALLGLAVLFVRRALPLRRGATRAQALDALAPALVLLVAALGALIGMFGYYLNSPDGHAARYTFPGLAAIGCLLFAGWAELSGARARWVAVAAGTALCALSVYAVFVLVPGTYARPALVADAPAGPATRFGDVAEVLAAQIEPDGAPLHPGDALTVRLTWRALQRTSVDYAVYVHVIDDAGAILAQRDTYPGLGRYPSTAWNPGDVWIDTIRVLLPPGAYTPNTLQVNFGLYDYAGGARLPVTAVAPAAPPAGTQRYALAAPPGAPWPNATDVNFDGRLALRGYTLAPRSVHPGATITLTLYWTALAPHLEPYTVFAHVAGPGDAVYANGDGVPVGGLAPTPLWKPGEIISDTHLLRLAPDTPPGQYDVELGWYHSDTLERLLILEANGVRAHDRWLLSPIRVNP